ncbi:hypothetical protein ANO11243_096100 [Dothideomycetidae sp. 11243]|nr:hypothetical protein ANO11243_096100 [fungal sp. No.11243]
MPADRRIRPQACAPAVDRVHTDVILSIKPRFVELIVSGEKNHEYRKYKLRDSVVRLWLYETAPSSRIRYVVKTTTPKTQGQVKDPSGIGNDDFDAGLKPAKYGYPVLDIYELPSALTAAILRRECDVSPPQRYCFVPESLFEAMAVTDLPSTSGSSKSTSDEMCTE